MKHNCNVISKPSQKVRENGVCVTVLKLFAASFSPVTSTTGGISLQNFLTYIFNPFATLV